MLDPARQQRQGGLERTRYFRYHPYCPPLRPADDHRPPRFIAFLSAHISKANTPLAYRDSGASTSGLDASAEGLGLSGLLASEGLGRLG